MLQNYTNITNQKCDRNIFLNLIQKRLRHIKLISANNLKIPANVKKFHVWYSIHDSATIDKLDSRQLIYISDKKENDLNPKWTNLNHSKIRHEHLILKNFIIRIWFLSLESTLNEEKKLLVEMSVSLSGLYQLSDEYLNDTLKIADNLIVFDMFNHHYSEIVNQSQQNHSKNELALLLNSLKLQQLNKIKFKQSYQLALLMRLNEFEKVIYNTIKNINRLKIIIKAKFNETSKLNELKTKKELYLQRIQMLRTECERKRENILGLKESNLIISDENLTIKKSIVQKKLITENKMRKIDEIQVQNENLLTELMNLKEIMVKKQRQLIKNLSKIYPIENVLDNNSSSNEINIDQQLKIANVYLPNSKFYLNNDEQQINVGLGYVCHCLLILCSILNIPLRHPIIYRASKSTIINYTQDKNFLNLIASASISSGTSPGSSSSSPTNASNLSSNENFNLQELALYRTNAVHETSFSYAVFLLNKNLAQLRILFDNYKNFDFNNTLGSLFWLLNQT